MDLFIVFILISIIATCILSWIMHAVINTLSEKEKQEVLKHLSDLNNNY